MNVDFESIFMLNDSTDTLISNRNHYLFYCLGYVRRKEWCYLEMKLDPPEGDHPDSSDEITVTACCPDKTPILIQRHQLTRWNKRFVEWINDDRLELIAEENWDDILDCIRLLRCEEVEVTFDNVKVNLFVK